ncbi:MAG TPA: tetratricopeptide repeat protein [Verrucomicrobiae bacterium]|nr:tetratricopeptide repeat protein [Verrucomicrobiae bacterium]
MVEKRIGDRTKDVLSVMKFNRLTEERRNWIAGIGLFIVTVALYWPTVWFPFVNYDDQLYVYQNPVVLKGLSWAGIKYALTSNVVGHWHPLTMISLMADASVYHSFAGGYHLTNVLVHAINAVLLLFLIKRMTGLFWPGIVVAMLFAVHPLNAESVSWIAERKNVLSTFFFILTVLAYLRYAETPGPMRYLLTLLLFVLGLMAKAMLVTLPCLLFLLDYWPLQRIFPAENSSKANGIPELRLLVLEKIPFLAFAAGDCVIEYVTAVHGGAVETLSSLPFEARMVNIPIAYLTYLEKSIWPAHLCVLYAFPEKLPIAPAAVSLALLIMGPVAAWHWRWQYRWLIVGWLWFIGMLVPVIGVVQAGIQAWADHHAYVPIIGLFLIAGCGLYELWGRWRPSRPWLVLACTGFLCVCACLARQQMDCWQNSVALFSQAIAVNPNNAAAQAMLAASFNGEKQYSNAADHYAVAVRLKPENAEYELSLGLALVHAGRFREAIAPLEIALKRMPADAGLRNTLGVALMQSGKSHEAENQFDQAIALQPNYPKSYFNLGEVLLKEEQPKPAITNFVTALRAAPNWPQAMERLAAAYAAEGDSSNAISTASRALALAKADYQSDLANEIAKELDAYQSHREP